MTIFDGEENRAFVEFIEDAMSEVNFIYGYGRYLRKHAVLDAVHKEQAYESGQELIKESKAVKESLRLIKQEIEDLDAGFKKSEEENLQWTMDEYRAEFDAYVKKRKKLAKKFAGESLRVVWLRKPMDEVLRLLDLPKRRKYQRKIDEESEDD